MKRSYPRMNMPKAVESGANTTAFSKLIVDDAHRFGNSRNPKVVFELPKRTSWESNRVGTYSAVRLSQELNLRCFVWKSARCPFSANRVAYLGSDCFELIFLLGQSLLRLYSSRFDWPFRDNWFRRIVLWVITWNESKIQWENLLLVATQQPSNHPCPHYATVHKFHKRCIFTRAFWPWRLQWEVKKRSDLPAQEDWL